MITGSIAGANNAYSQAIDWPGGKGTFMVYGTFDSATFTLYRRIGQGTKTAAASYVAMDSAAIFTSSDAVNFEWSPDTLCVGWTGGGSSQSITWRVDHTDGSKSHLVMESTDTAVS